jgi:hypothetical protein
MDWSGSDDVILLEFQTQFHDALLNDPVIAAHFRILKEHKSLRDQIPDSFFIRIITVLLQEKGDLHRLLVDALDKRSTP